MSSSVQGGYVEVNTSVTSATTIFTQDCNQPLNIRWVSLQLLAPVAWGGVTVQFEGSNDNATWLSVFLEQSSGGSFTSTTSTGMFDGPINYRYFRARVSGYTSGTVQAIAEFSSVPSLTSNQRVVLFDGTNQVGAGGTNSDGVGTDAASNHLRTQSTNYLYNGTSFDRQRANQDNVSLVASAAYTTTQTGGDQTNYNSRGVIVVLDMTVVGTGSVTLEIDGKDPVSGKYYALLTGAAVTTNSTNIYTVYPGGPATANVAANSPLPRTWRAKVTANNANSATYSVGASVIL